MENIKNIACYHSAYDLLYDYDPSLFPLLIDDMETYFEHFDDFEGLQYFLFNNETVIVTESGDVQGDPMTPEELYRSIITDYYNNVGDREMIEYFEMIEEA